VPSSRQQPDSRAATGRSHSLRLSSFKLRPAELRPLTIRRPRLTRELTDTPAKLVLVVAPPGHGKTSLLADWAEHDRRPFAWVTVDRNDSDPAVLWAYVASAVARARGEEGSASGQASAEPPDPSRLARELETSDHLVLALDDYFLIEGSASHVSLQRFIELAPPTVTIAIVSRVEPPLPVARLRANRQVVDIGPGDLRFTREESEAFLIASLGLDMDAASIDVLHERTEGWPAGLYLAYLSLQHAPDPGGFVQRFGASNRHVGDYLTEQVLEAQDPETLKFMLATSIVDHVCGPLADALTGRTDSASRLAELERANVFLTALDDSREWYRYHHLLREFLLIELRKRAPETEEGLHRRAAEWFEATGDVDRAIQQATSAGDVEQAARLIVENHVLRLEWGQFETLARWLESVGHHVVESDARLLIVQSWTMHFLGRHAEGQRALAAARRLGFGGDAMTGVPSLESSAAMIGAAFPGGDVAEAVRAARRAFDLEADREPMRVTVHVALGYALVRAGNFEEARTYLETGEALAVSAGMWMDAVGARSLRALVDLASGEPSLAIERARAAVDLAWQHGIGPTGAGAYARGVLGRVLVDAGQPAEGVAALGEALEPLRAMGEPLPVAEVLLALAQGYFSLGRPRAAKQALAETDALIQSMVDPGVLRAARRSIAVAANRRSGLADAPLSGREVEVLRLLAQHKSKREIAANLFVSYNTVHSHVRTIYRKLGVGNRAAAIARAQREGLLPEARPANDQGITRVIH
jgi:LuxR family transcriptional regulator, maltose regulon positive regulatory protein